MCNILSDDFINTIFLYITKEPKKHNCGLLKKHVDNLNTYGEFSMPSPIEPWKSILNISETENIKTLQDYYFLANDKPIESVITESFKWCLRISHLTESKDRLCIHLNRIHSCREIIKNVKNRLREMKISLENRKVSFECESDQYDSLTYLRLRTLKSVTENLSSLREQKDVPNIYFTTKSSDKISMKGHHVVVCAPVLNKQGKKETSYTGAEYVKKRQTDMSLMAQHKYGVRVSAQPQWAGLLTRLGHAAASYDLLETKHSHAVTVGWDHQDSGSSKGAAFVLYNCARLASIIRTFEEKVQSKLYPPLPDLDSIDFALLKDEDEWALIFNYLLGLDRTLLSCFEVDDVRCRVAPHLLCSYLASLVKTFSVYYKRVRVLTEGREHLLPVLFARMHLIYSLHSVLETTLTILGIQAVTQM